MMRVLTTIALCVTTLCGCTTAGRSCVAEIRGGVWDGAVVAEMANSDTTGLYDMRIALRHNGLAEGESIGMTVRTVTPDSLWVEEPLTICVADDGRSRPAQHEASVIYRRRVRLSREGIYRITVTPDREVRGVTAVGVELMPSRGEE